MVKDTHIHLILIMISPPRQSFDEDVKGPRLGELDLTNGDFSEEWDE